MSTYKRKKSKLSTPKGFKQKPSIRYSLSIVYKRSGFNAGCGKLIFLYMFLGWLFFFCILSSMLLFDRDSIAEGQITTVIIIVLGLLILFFIFAILYYVVYSCKFFKVNREKLVFGSRMLLFSRSISIPLASIKNFIQDKSEGTDDEESMWWDLKVEGDNDATILYGVSYKDSHWLGKTLSQHTGIEFFEA